MSVTAKDLPRSPIPWAPTLPSGWETRRLKFLFRREQRTPRDEDGVVTAFRDGQVALRERRRVDGYTNSLQEVGYQGVRRGDLVIHAMDAFAGAIGVSEDDGKSTPVYAVCTPKSGHIDTQYYAILLRHMALSGFVAALARGVRERSTEFRWADAGEVLVPLPSATEQTAIVAFVDRETAKIDALVEEQRRLIELLKEKRQAIIAHAVTKGLNANANLKPSGVEWLGDVPAHWEVKRLRFLCNISTGDGDTVDADDDAEYPFFVRSPTIERIGRYTHDCEAVLTSGDGAGVGKIFHHVQGKFAAHQRVYIFDRFRGVSGRFFFNFLKENFYKVALEGGAKSTVDSLRRPVIANFWMTVPPIDEQAAIVREADHLEFRYQELINEAEAAIGLLQERRFAIVSGAVTGQIVAAANVANEQATIDIQALVATDVIERLAGKKTFGRVKFQKIIYLAEAHGRISEFGGKYLREAAGPLDRDLINAVEENLVRTGRISIEQTDGPGGQVTYKVHGRKGEGRDNFASALGDRADRLDQIIDAVTDLDTKATEAVATLYAVWNDFLLDGATPSDGEVVSGVLNDWHPEKRDKFRADDLHTWLGWMRRHSMTPSGSGPRTTTGRLFP